MILQNCLNFQHVVCYEENLPSNWYPTYRGKLFSFKTKLTVQLICSGGKKLKTFFMNVKINPSALNNPDIVSKYSAMFLAGNEFEREDPLEKTNPFNSTSQEKGRYLVKKKNLNIFSILNLCSKIFFSAFESKIWWFGRKVPPNKSQGSKCSNKWFQWVCFILTNFGSCNDFEYWTLIQKL